MLTRGIALRGALDAQGLIYAIVKWDPPTDWDEASRQAFLRFRAGDAALPPPRAPREQVRHRCPLRPRC